MNVLQEKILAASELISLILVFTTILFDIRYPQIQEDLRKEAPTGPIALKRFKSELMQSLLWKSLPLFFVNAFVFYMFLPSLHEILITTRLNLWRFDFIVTAFTFIALAELLLAVWAAYLSIKLIQRIRKISAEMKSDGGKP